MDLIAKTLAEFRFDLLLKESDILKAKVKLARLEVDLRVMRVQYDAACKAGS
jgi:hypothetical protein